jgi:hypothetical protein
VRAALLPLMLLFAAPAAADDGPRPEEGPLLSWLASEYGTTIAEVARLRSAGGWADAARALEIARRAGRPPEEIMQARRLGTPWEDLVNKYGADADAVEAVARRAARLAQDLGVDTRPDIRARNRPDRIPHWLHHSMHMPGEDAVPAGPSEALTAPGKDVR